MIHSTGPIDNPGELTNTVGLATFSASIEMEISGGSFLLLTQCVNEMAGSIVCTFPPVSDFGAVIPSGWLRKEELCGTCMLWMEILGCSGQILSRRPSTPVPNRCCHCCPAKGKWSALVEVLQAGSKEPMFVCKLSRVTQWPYAEKAVKNNP